jgi:hypothetical protein
MDINHKQNKLKSILIYSCVAIFTILINIPLFLNVTGYLILGVKNYFFPPKPVIFPNLTKLLFIDFMCNLILILILEFIVVLLFNKQLNKLFRIYNLFTIKKFLLLSVIIIIIQIILNLLLLFI